MQLLFPLYIILTCAKSFSIIGKPLIYRLTGNNHISPQVAQRIRIVRRDGFKAFILGIGNKIKSLRGKVHLRNNVKGNLDKSSPTDASSPTISSSSSTSLSWTEDEANYFDEVDVSIDVSELKKGWEFEEASYFDEADSLNYNHDYYESTLENEIKSRMASQQTEYIGLDESALLLSSFVDTKEAVGITFNKDQRDGKLSFPQSSDAVDNLIKGWEGFSEEPPYYDDDYLLDENNEDQLLTFPAGYVPTSKSTNPSDVSDDSDSYVIRDKAGTILGWSDWNENEASYFDEVYMNEDEVTFGARLVNSKKGLVDSTAGSSEILSLFARTNKDKKAKGGFETDFPPPPEGKQGEWTDWDSDIYLIGEDDFGTDIA